MPDRRLHAVQPGGGLPAPRSGPGLAVLLVLAYATLFGAGLWWFRSRSPLFSGVSPSPAPALARPTPETAGRESGRAGEDRRKLLRGEGLIGAAREDYLRRIATDCCGCGCDLSLERCLATEKTCPESPSRAETILRELR